MTGRPSGSVNPEPAPTAERVRFFSTALSDRLTCPPARVCAERHAREVDGHGARGRVGGTGALVAPGRVEVVAVEGDRGEVVVAAAVAGRRGGVADLQRRAERAAVVE